MFQTNESFNIQNDLTHVLENGTERVQYLAIVCLFIFVLIISRVRAWDRLTFFILFIVALLS
jgi:hypothetical protein